MSDKQIIIDAFKAGFYSLKTNDDELEAKGSELTHKLRTTDVNNCIHRD